MTVSARGAQTQYLRSNQTNEAWALFGSINYAVSDALDLSAGVRYTHDEKDFATGVPQGFTFTDPGVADHCQSERQQGELGSERHVCAH